jgi:hypothetical protein
VSSSLSLWSAKAGGLPKISNFRALKSVSCRVGHVCSASWNSCS